MNVRFSTLLPISCRQSKNTAVSGENPSAWFRSIVHAFRDWDSTLLHCTGKLLVIGRDLVGIDNGEFSYGRIEFFGFTTIAVQHAGVPGASFVLTQNLAAHLGIFAQSAAFEIFRGDDRFVVGKLAKAENLEIPRSVGLLEAFYLRHYLTDLPRVFLQLLTHNHIDRRLLDRRLRSLGLPPL